MSHQNTFRDPGKCRLKIVFLSNEDLSPRLKLFFTHQNEKNVFLRSFQIQHCACVKTEVGRRLVNSACSKFLVLLFNMILWSYIVDKMQENVQGVASEKQNLRVTCPNILIQIFFESRYIRLILSLIHI